MPLPSTVDLRPRYQTRTLSPRAQANRGTCSLFALVGVLEYESGDTERLSVEYLNWASHQTNKRRTDGSFFSDALEGVRRFGICADDLLPYAPTFDPNLAPPPIARADAQKRRAITAHWIKPWDVKTGLNESQLTMVRRFLADGHPVACGLRWPKKAVYVAHRLNHPPPAEVFDGHSIVLVGYSDHPALPGGGEFLFRNSSGPDWQEQGHARFSYDYARAYANDAVALTVDWPRGKYPL